LETDIRMGQEAGMLTALVLTGATRREQTISLDQPPTWILDHVGQLLDKI
ncbi:MAG: HAD hydrolase-like protein, partial [Anaerolineales bacterium]|nr:HAD hydrolase-like protein [Anaerolineales bacterium]